MAASHQGHLAVVRDLLAAKADVDARDNDGNTALLKAYFNADVAKLLLDCSATIRSHG